MRKLVTPAALIVVLGRPVLSQTPLACVPESAAQRARIAGYDALILRNSERRRLNPRLVKAVIATESQFTAWAVSRKGARGLMQLMPATALEMGVPARSLSDPDANIRAGTKYLSALFAAQRRDGRGAPGAAARRALAAYHSGPRALSAAPWSASTRSYIRAVLTCYRSDASALHFVGPEPALELASLIADERAESRRGDPASSDHYLIGLRPGAEVR